MVANTTRKWLNAAATFGVISALIPFITFPSHGYGLPKRVIELMFYSLPIWMVAGVICGVVWAIRWQKEFDPTES
jgi:hypothetical protein